MSANSHSSKSKSVPQAAEADVHETRQPADTSASNGHKGRGLAIPKVNLRSMMFAIVMVAGFAELSYVIVNISAMPVYITAIGLDAHWIGLIATAFLLTEGVLKSPFGLLGDRIGRKTLILAGPSVSIVTSFLTPYVHNPYALVGLRVVDGTGAAALWPAAFSLIGDHVPEKKRATAMSLFNVAYLLGVALGPAIGGGINDWSHHYLGLSEAMSKQSSFYVASGLFALTALIALIYIPKIRPGQHHHDDTTPGAEGFNFGDFKRMLGRMPAMLVMSFVTFLSVGLVMAYTKIYVCQRFDLSESGFGALLIGPALVIAAVSVPLGTLGDRIGKAKAVRLGMGLCSVGFWLLILLASKLSLVVFGSVIGIGFVVAFPAWMALVSSCCDSKQRGAAVGAVGTAQGIGAIVGVAASAILYKLPAFSLGFVTLPEHSLPFLGCALMLTLAFILAMTTMHDPKSAEKSV